MTCPRTPNSCKLVSNTKSCTAPACSRTALCLALLATPWPDIATARQQEKAWSVHARRVTTAGLPLGHQTAPPLSSVEHETLQTRSTAPWDSHRPSAPAPLRQPHPPAHPTDHGDPAGTLTSGWEPLPASRTASDAHPSRLPTPPLRGTGPLRQPAWQFLDGSAASTEGGPGAARLTPWWMADSPLQPPHFPGEAVGHRAPIPMVFTTPAAPKSLHFSHESKIDECLVQCVLSLPLFWVLEGKLVT